MNEAHPVRLLLIEDEIQLRRLLKITLEHAQYAVTAAETGQLGLAEAASSRPDAMVLDLGLPDLDGVEVLRRLREWSQIPVLVLTVRDSEDTMIAALDAGADDYLTKPFSSRELLARLRAVLRRVQPTVESPVIRFGDVELDFGARIVRRAGVPVRLTRKEYDLLTYLAQHAGRVVTHPQLLRALWGARAQDNAQYLRVYMTRLRQKLETDPHQPKYLRTDAGVGYRLTDVE
ncbi:MAG TPA: response regulator transcription factor [Opitutaceae bacterium]|nr:response regulator transcription factor [Opitutaceae bacterium]